MSTNNDGALAPPLPKESRALAPRDQRWRVRNEQGVPHHFHVHNAAFEVTDLDGRTPPPDMHGRKDTVFLPPGSQVGLVVSFGQCADPHWPYMFHCHLLARRCGDNGTVRCHPPGDGRPGAPTPGIRDPARPASVTVPRVPVRWRDAGTALLVAASVWLAVDIAVEPAIRPPLLAGWALGIMLSGLQLARRRFPVAVLTVSAAAVVLYHLVGYPAIGLAWPC